MTQALGYNALVVALGLSVLGMGLGVAGVRRGRW